MLASTNQSVPEAVLRNLGYQNTDDFLRTQARHVLEQKISYYQSRVDFYQHKYSMSLDEFYQRVIDQNDSVLSGFGVLEKENDDVDWDDAVDFVRIYTADLHQIRP